MPLLEEFESSGNWLFRWRSYLPLLLLALVFPGFEHFRYPFGSHFLDEIWEIVCVGVSFCGLCVRALTIGYAPRRTSGRNTKEHIADELNTTGMYSVVRNPLYLGNFLMFMGVMLFLRAWWMPLIYLLVFMLYYERIIFAEEMFLRRKFGEAYLEWATKTPAFVPRLRRWRKPSLRFSWRTVVRREYHGAFAVLIADFALDALSEIYLGHGFVADTMWRYILGGGVLAYVVIRILHKYTRLLSDPGR